MVTKNQSGANQFPTYDSLESSLSAMRELMIKNADMQLAIPQIGCGKDIHNSSVQRINDILFYFSGFQRYRWATVE